MLCIHVSLNLFSVERTAIFNKDFFDWQTIERFFNKKQTARDQNFAETAPTSNYRKLTDKREPISTSSRGNA